MPFRCLIFYLKEFDKMFFFPDQHLGRNTGAKLAFRSRRWFLWNPHLELGGNTEKTSFAKQIDLVERALLGARTL